MSNGEGSPRPSSEVEGSTFTLAGILGMSPEAIEAIRQQNPNRAKSLTDIRVRDIRVRAEATAEASAEATAEDVVIQWTGATTLEGAKDALRKLSTEGLAEPTEDSQRTPS